MDVIGTIASSVQLLNNVVVAVQSIRNLPVKIQEQRHILKELLDIAEEVRRNELLQTNLIAEILQSISKTVGDIQKKLPGPSSKGKGFSRHFHIATYYFNSDDILALMQSLEPAKSSLQICISNEQAKCAGRSSEGVEEIRSKVNDIHRSMGFKALSRDLEEERFTPTSASSLISEHLANEDPQPLRSPPLPPRQLLSPVASHTWYQQVAMDSARQFNGNMGPDHVMPSMAHYLGIRAGDGAQQMNGDIVWTSPSVHQGRGPKRTVWKGVIAEGQSKQMNGSFYDPEGGITWPMQGQ